MEDVSKFAMVQNLIYTELGLGIAFLFLLFTALVVVIRQFALSVVIFISLQVSDAVRLHIRSAFVSSATAFILYETRTFKQQSGNECDKHKRHGHPRPDTQTYTEL